MEKKRWKFAEVESALAEINEIAGVRRTAFQARIKNFHRLGFPPDLETIKGKAALYDAGQVYSLALAVELTQFGLNPERIISVLVSSSFPTTMAARMACGSRPPSDESLLVYLYFDPSALDPLQEDWTEDKAEATFFYAGQGVLRELISEWPEDNSRRLSLLLVSKLIDLLVRQLGPEFESELTEWADNDDALDGPDWTETNLQKIAGVLGTSASELAKQFGDRHGRA